MTLLTDAEGLRQNCNEEADVRDRDHRPVPHTNDIRTREPEGNEDLARGFTPELKLRLLRPVLRSSGIEIRAKMQTGTAYPMAVRKHVNHQFFSSRRKYRLDGVNRSIREALEAGRWAVPWLARLMSDRTYSFLDASLLSSPR